MKTVVIGFLGSVLDVGKTADRWRAWLQHGQRAGATQADLYAAALSAHRLRQYDQALALAQRLNTLAGADTRWISDALLMELWLAPGAPRSPLADRMALAVALWEVALADGETISTGRHALRWLDQVTEHAEGIARYGAQTSGPQINAQRPV